MCALLCGIIIYITTSKQASGGGGGCCVFSRYTTCRPHRQKKNFFFCKPSPPAAAAKKITCCCTRCSFLADCYTVRQLSINVYTALYIHFNWCLLVCLFLYWRIIISHYCIQKKKKKEQKRNVLYINSLEKTRKFLEREKKHP